LGGLQAFQIAANTSSLLIIAWFKVGEAELALGYPCLPKRQRRQALQAPA